VACYTAHFTFTITFTFLQTFLEKFCKNLKVMKNFGKIVKFETNEYVMKLGAF